MREGDGHGKKRWLEKSRFFPRFIKIAEQHRSRKRAALPQSCALSVPNIEPSSTGKTLHCFNRTTLTEIFCQRERLLSRISKNQSGSEAYVVLQEELKKSYNVTRKMATNVLAESKSGAFFSIGRTELMKVG